MPRLSEAMKDVISCDKLRVGANNLLSGDFRMGQPGGLVSRRRKTRTRRTETSQYPQEKKSTDIPLVAASERGSAQTDPCVSGTRCRVGVVGVSWEMCIIPRSYKTMR